MATRLRVTSQACGISQAGSLLCFLIGLKPQTGCRSPPSQASAGPAHRPGALLPCAVCRPLIPGNRMPPPHQWGVPRGHLRIHWNSTLPKRTYRMKDTVCATAKPSSQLLVLPCPLPGAHAQAHRLFRWSASHRFWLASGSSASTSTASHSPDRLDRLMASTTLCM